MNINSHIQLSNCVLRNFRDEIDPEKKVWYLDVQTGDIMRKSSKNSEHARDTILKQAKGFGRRTLKTHYRS